MHTSGSRGAWPSNDDYTALSLLVIVLGSAFFGCLAWWNYHAEISYAVALLVQRQIWLIGHFTHALDPLAFMVRSADPETVTLHDILSVLNATGAYLRAPAIGFMVVLAALCFMRAAPSRFTRDLDLGGLIREQARTFRPLAAFVDRDLRLVSLPEDAPLRPCDPALHGREWVRRFATDPNGGFSEGAAARALAAQLGPLWRGANNAAPHARFFYAVFALHLDQQREAAKALLGALAEALPQAKWGETAGPTVSYLFPDALASAAEEQLERSEARAQADIIACKHAYTAPVLMALLTAARRRGGVLAPAQFACLKMIDRNLWYALHSLGFEGDGPGQTTHPNPRVEAAGTRDHWESERLIGRKLVTPSIQRALDAVRTVAGQA